MSITFDEAKDICKTKLINEKDLIIQSLNYYSQQVLEHITQLINEQKFNEDSQLSTLLSTQLSQSYNNLIHEIEIIKHNMSILLHDENDILKIIFNTTNDKQEIYSKRIEIKNLNISIQEISHKLNDIINHFSHESLEQIYLHDYIIETIQYILDEKESIIQNIKTYDNQHILNHDNINFVNQFQIKNDLNIILNNFHKIIKFKHLYFNKFDQEEINTKTITLQSNINEIKSEIKNSLNKQLLQMHQHTLDDNQQPLSSQNIDYKNIDYNILDNINSLLQKNEDTMKSINNFNELHKFTIPKKFITINNLFYRTKLILKNIDLYISKYPDKPQSTNILDEYSILKNNINKHIDFLDLNKYIHNPNIQSTQTKDIPPEFIQELNNIFEYYNSNFNIFKKQHLQLTNIFEDLSSIIRVYNSVKSKIVPDFYTVFNNNEDKFILNSETLVDSGLLNSFKQLENGYSITLFNYSNNTDNFNILHNIFTNLHNIKQIKLKYAFEQYIHTFEYPNITGNIINLVNNIPQLQKYNIDESSEFNKYFPTNIDLNNIKINDLYNITNTITKYRTQHNRTKTSFLYTIYKVIFNEINENSQFRYGYITLINVPTKTSIQQHKNDDKQLTNTLNEQIYINECVNHLIYFLNKQQSKFTQIVKQKSLQNYNYDNFFVNPNNEESSIYLTNNSLTIPILNFIKVLSHKNKRIKNLIIT